MSVQATNNKVSPNRADKAYNHNNLRQVAMSNSASNTQLRTHFGYYLSTRPTIQQLTK